MVVARLTCAPGRLRLAGNATATAGRVTAEPDAVTWRLSVPRIPVRATFSLLADPGSGGGPVAGEITTTGSVSNCPALRAADTPVASGCRVTVVLPAPIMSRAVVPSAARPPVWPAPRPPVPSAPRPPVPPGTPPAAPSTASVLPAPLAGHGPAPLPLPTLPLGSSSPSPAVLTQLDRPPVVPAPTPGLEAAAPGATAEPALRPLDSRADLGGRVLAFLIGGVAFLLIALALAGSLIGARPRRGEPDGEVGTGLRALFRSSARAARHVARRRTPARSAGHDVPPQRSGDHRTLKDLVQSGEKSGHGADDQTADHEQRRSLPTSGKE